MKYCEEFAALLDLYVDGELSPAEAARVQAHLESCPGCRRYVDDALAIRAAFPDAEDAMVPEGFAGSVMAAVREAAERKAAGRRRVYWQKVVLPLAACVALVVVLRAVPGGGNGSAPAGDSAAPSAAMDNAVVYGTAEKEDEAYDAAEEPAAAPYSLAAAPQMAAGGEEAAPEETDGEALPEAADNAAPKEVGGAGSSRILMAPAAAPQDEPAAAPQDEPAASGGTAGAAEEAPILQADEEWVEYGNVVFAAVVYLDKDDVGDALDGYEGKPYSNANLPEEGVIGTGYALEQEDFEHILYDVLDYPLGPMLNQDRTTELNCIVVTGS